MDNYDHPWQQGPAEIIKYAIRIMENHSDDSLYKRISFLMLDVGVEITLKVFISLPNDVTTMEVKHSERLEAMQGGFSSLIQYIKKNAGSRLTNIDLDEIHYFHHNVRNKLYHEGDGITVTHQIVQRYVDLAVKLLYALLEVEFANEKIVIEDYKSKEEILSTLRIELELCIENLLPALLLPDFREKIIMIDEYTPLKALWQLSSIIEDTFSVDFNNCFSKDDIEKVNEHLAKTCGTKIELYKSKKDIVFQIFGGFFGWQWLKINNLLVGGYCVSSLVVYDFIKNRELDRDDFINIYLKIICEIIDTETLKGNNVKPKIRLMQIADKYDYLVGPNFYFEEHDYKEMLSSLQYLFDSIKSWREEKFSN